MNTSRLSPAQLEEIKARIDSIVSRAFDRGTTKASTLFCRHGIHMIRAARERRRWLRESGLWGFYNRFDTPDMWEAVREYRALAQKARRRERGA